MAIQVISASRHRTFRTFIAQLACHVVGFGQHRARADGDSNRRLVSDRTEWLSGRQFQRLTIFDFTTCARKLQGQTHLNLLHCRATSRRAVLSVTIPSASVPKTAGEIVREAVLELTYTAHDMASFARDLGYLNEGGEVKQPFVWDEERRLHLRAKLDAVFFHLYGVTNRDDVRYVSIQLSPSSNARKWQPMNCYRSRDLCLAWMNALAAGQPDARVEGVRKVLHQKSRAD